MAHGGDVYTIIRASSSAQPDDFADVICYATHYFYGGILRQYPQINYSRGSNVTEMSKDLISRIEGIEEEAEPN